jgi:hypothetical protein
MEKIIETRKEITDRLKRHLAPFSLMVQRDLTTLTITRRDKGEISEDDKTVVLAVFDKFSDVITCIYKKNQKENDKLVFHMLRKRVC